MLIAVIMTTNGPWIIKKNISEEIGDLATYLGSKLYMLAKYSFKSLPCVHC